MSEPNTGVQSIFRIRWIGYGFLIFFLIDTLQLLIPPNFTNPAWELQTIGQLVERVIVPLLGLALVFFGEYENRTVLEEIVLKVMSWGALLLAVIFLLMLPLGIVNTVRLSAQVSQQIQQQADQRIGQLDELNNRVQNATADQIEALAQQLQASNIPLNARNPDEIKTAVTGRVADLKKQVTTQASTEIFNQQRGLLEDAVKWNLGALLASGLFFIIWRTTRWAR